MIQAAIIALIPLIVYLHKVTPPAALTAAFNWPVQYDLITFWKDKFLWGMSLLSLTTLSLPGKKIGISLALYIGFLYIATVHGLDPELSFWGMPEYSEGAMTLLCYVVLVLTSRNVKTVHIVQFVKFLIIALCVLTALQLTFGNFIGLPVIKSLTGMAHTKSNSPRTPIYVTLGNPNHLGLLCALLLPLTLSSHLPVYAVLLSALAIGSGSRGAMLSIFITSFLLASHQFSRKRMAVIGSVVILAFGIVVFPRILRSYKDLNPAPAIDDLKEFTVLPDHIDIKMGEASLTVHPNQIPPGGLFFPYRHTSTQMVVVDGQIRVPIWNGLWNTLPHHPQRIPESLFSGRGFIWANTLRSLTFFGKGPATSVLDFPQLDLMGKLRAGWGPDMIVDRPHSLYLQIAHATGILSLLPLGFIVFIALRKRTLYRTSLIGFLICAIFTDSFVGVTPIFCILLGKTLGEEEA